MIDLVEPITATVWEWIRVCLWRMGFIKPTPFEQKDIEKAKEIRKAKKSIMALIGITPNQEIAKEKMDALEAWERKAWEEDE